MPVLDPLPDSTPSHVFTEIPGRIARSGGRDRYLFASLNEAFLMVHSSIGRSPVDWGGKAYPEIESLAREDGSILVLPVASIEQHGYHMPTATDTILADAVAKGGAEAVSDDLPVLVGPPITPGYSPHHMVFGGTLTLEFDTMLAAVEDIVASSLEAGFDAVLLLNGHGGNIPLINTAVTTIGKDHEEALIYGISYFYLAESFIDDLRDSEPGGMGHAGEFETSLMLHLRPDLVDTDRMDGTNMDDPHELTLNDMFDGGPLAVYHSFEYYTDSGTIGDPTHASAEKGERLYDGLTDELGSLLGEIHEQAV